MLFTTLYSRVVQTIILLFPKFSTRAPLYLESFSSLQLGSSSFLKSIKIATSKIFLHSSDGMIKQRRRLLIADRAVFFGSGAVGEICQTSRKKYREARTVLADNEEVFQEFVVEFAAASVQTIQTNVFPPSLSIVGSFCQSHIPIVVAFPQDFKSSSHLDDKLRMIPNFE